MFVFVFAIVRFWLAAIVTFPPVAPPVKASAAKRVRAPVPFFVIPKPIPEITLSMVRFPVPLWSISKPLPRTTEPVERPIV